MGGASGGYIKPVTSPPLCGWGKYPSGKVHRALDYPVIVGTPFRVARAGVVKVAGLSYTGFGNHIRVLLDDGNTVIYGHLSKFYVKVGQRVSAGQFIGETGNTGNSTGPHLHMEVRSFSWSPLSAWDYTPFLVSAPVAAQTVAPTPPPLTFMERIMALSSTEQTEFNGAVSEALVYALRSAPSVRAEVAKIVQATVAGVVGYKNTDLSDRDVFAMVRGEAGTTLGQVAADVAETQAQVAALTSAVAALVALVQESHPKAEPVKVPATQYGVDVSGWQTVERVDTVTADPKYGFVIVKASQGQRSGNDAHDSQVAEVRQAGLCVGHYHFAECDQDPIAELDNFLARAKVQPGDVVALDAEDWDQKDHPERMANTPWTQRLDYVLRWLEEAERRLGVRPLVYVNWNWIKGLRTAATQEQWERLTRFDCWLAQWFLKGVAVKPGEYDHINDKDGSPDGWRVVMHQWTNNDGGLDGNFMPDPSAWAHYAIPA